MLDFYQAIAYNGLTDLFYSSALSQSSARSLTCPHKVGPLHPASHRIFLDEQSSTLTFRRKAISLMNSTFLQVAPLLLSAGFALLGTTAAHAQEFTFTTPTSSTLIVHPGDTVTFSGSVFNDTIDQLDGVTIGFLGNTNYAGKFTFASLFFANIGRDTARNFTGTLKISNTATFTPTVFELAASGVYDADPTGGTIDLTSSPFTVRLAPAAVPEASSLVSTGILLTLGLGAFALRSRKRTAKMAGAAG